LPQVTADYRLLIYFRDIDGIFVNLYLPSTLRATNADGAQLTLTQTGDYPFDGKITMRLGLSRPSKLSVRLRIPAWSLASNPVIRVNGARLSPPVTSGFATLSRRWDDGDRIEIDLPLPTRLEPIDPQHPDTVALMRGPLVLFPITETSTAVTRAQLLSATRLANQSAWQANTGSGPLELRPFTAIQDQPYTTYLNVTGTAPS
jgi:DUF1680 family protein